MVLAYVMPVSFFEWLGEVGYQFFLLLDSLRFENFTLANIIIGCALSYSVVKILRSMGGI